MIALMVDVSTRNLVRRVKAPSEDHLPEPDDGCEWIIASRCHTISSRGITVDETGQPVSADKRVSRMLLEQPARVPRKRQP